MAEVKQIITLCADINLTKLEHSIRKLLQLELATGHQFISNNYIKNTDVALLSASVVNGDHTYQELFQIFIVGYDAIVNNNKFCSKKTPYLKTHNSCN